MLFQTLTEKFAKDHTRMLFQTLTEKFAKDLTRMLFQTLTAKFAKGLTGKLFKTPGDRNYCYHFEWRVLYSDCWCVT